MWAIARSAAIWLFGDDVVKYVLYIVAGLFVVAYIEATAATTAIMAQPFGQWWLASGAAKSTAAVAGVADVSIPRSIELVGVPQTGGVTDTERYQLAREVGWSPSDAIVATAISIAEDGSGDPAIMSPANRDGSRDLGLWQINSGWWAQFGGHDALIVPINNARAGRWIFGVQGWCAWSTYGDLQTCGVHGHTNAYLTFLGRARTAAGGSNA
jgi:Lysozyme like domain